MPALRSDHFGRPLFGVQLLERGGKLLLFELDEQPQPLSLICQRVRRSVGRTRPRPPVRASEQCPDVARAAFDRFVTVNPDGTHP